MKTYQRWSLMLLTTLFFTGCGGSGSSSGGNNTESKAGDLVSVTKLSTRTRTEITTTLGSLAGLITPAYTVDTYKVIYKTADTKGDIIRVSGLMVVPQKSSGASSPRIANHHGTIFLNQSAPSFNHQAFSESVIAASLGYIVTDPDYIGYGESAGQVHPHTHKETLAGASIDLLRASKFWLEQQNIAVNGQLFLTGYSEGGFAALAVQKVIQEELANEFTVTASVPAESAYNILETSQIQPDTQVFTFLFYGYITKAYDEIYELNLLSDMIRSEYFNAVNTLYDGTHSGAAISASLPPLNSSADRFFNRDFLQRFNNGEVPELSNRFTENTIHDWIPSAPTRFFHGRDDRVVAFDPVAQMVQTMQSEGAPDVALVECDAGGLPTTHANCFTPALLYSAQFFGQFANDL